jgi:acetyl-CoA carboxylase carboxyltransferase component
MATDEGSAVTGPAPGTELALDAPLQGTVVLLPFAPGDVVGAGAIVVVLESMKMEHVVRAPVSGTLVRLDVEVGALVAEGDHLAVVAAGESHPGTDAVVVDVDLDLVRADLAELFVRRGLLSDAGRPEVVARRHQAGRRTARENIEDLCDPGSFTEYGGFAIAAQRRRRPVEELIERTPADGLVGGTARVNGDRFADEQARCAVVSYDYTVLAGTQGQQNHRKKDRLFELVERLRLPLVLFAEGGGGRPGDTDYAVITGLDTQAFALFGRLSGLVPLVGIASGWCFAGNAALLGCCDVIIATEGASIGMGGPAMIEGGGLGTYRPEEVGPLDIQVPNGVVDLVAADDAGAVDLAKRYLSYFQGPVDEWSCEDQRLLRSAIPEERLRAYDIRALLDVLADTGSVLELRRGFAAGMVTALARIEGRPVGVVANDPTHLGGAIDADGADKAARFLQLCDAHDLPVVFLCDTPGFMVGPDAERTAQVRHVSRMFVTGASLTVPFCTIVLRKGYGLGAQAMAGGSFRSPVFLVAWPSGELGGMGLEGAVRLGFRRELEAVVDPVEREALFRSMVELAYEHGKALNVATAYEIDDVIDPAESRHRILEALRAVPPAPPRTGKKRSCIDTW